jgi:2-polyprenyl-3-methyl-5-hydroxy-6-metoxy-1,4-benzoquinol methylase
MPSTQATELPSDDSEHVRLARLAPDFSSHAGINARMIDMRFRAIRDWLAGAQRCVELGCSDGRMTALIAPVVGHLTAVDGSAAYIQAVRDRVPSVEAVNCLFEEFSPSEPYDVAVLAHVLEHVEDPVRVLRQAFSVLRPGGRAIVTVPNASSLHRQVGVAMGMIAHRAELNEGDRRIGHRRVYERDQLVEDVRAAGFTPSHVGGTFLKPLSDAQIEQQWSAELIEAFYQLGNSYPDICANLLVVAERPTADRPG